MITEKTLVTFEDVTGRKDQAGRSRAQVRIFFVLPCAPELPCVGGGQKLCSLVLHIKKVARKARNALYFIRPRVAADGWLYQKRKTKALMFQHGTQSHVA